MVVYIATFSTNFIEGNNAGILGVYQSLQQAKDSMVTLIKDVLSTYFD